MKSFITTRTPKQNIYIQNQNPLSVMRKDRLVDRSLVSYVIIIVLLNCSKRKVTNGAFYIRNPRNHILNSFPQKEGKKINAGDNISINKTKQIQQS